MKTSDNINELAAALAKAQGEIENPAKNTTNSHFKSRYADLAGGLATVRPTLAKHGLSVAQLTSADGDMMTLHTRLMHSSGQWLEATYPVCRLGKHQDMGSALTYARRYSLFAVIGVAHEDDDDDGNSAALPTPTKTKTSNAIKRDDPEAWPKFEKAVRAATNRVELETVWREWKDEFVTWPAKWRTEVDNLFHVRAGEVADRSTDELEAAE